MAEETDSKKLLMLNSQDGKPSASHRFRSAALYLSTLSLASLLMLAEIIVSILSGLGNANDFGFKNTTGNISDKYTTQITPAGWTFSIWGVIYLYQILWLTYAWSFALQPPKPYTIPWITFLIHAFSSVCTIVWLYVWGNDYPQVAFPVIVLVALALYFAEGFAAVYLYGQSPKVSKTEKVVANVLVINGIAIYATWLTFATLANFSIVLQYFAGVDAVTTGTAMLTVLTVEVVVYFALENTILDRYARYVFIVYPVLIYSLAGILSKHWNDVDRQNPIFTLVLEVVVCVLFIARIVLWILYHFFRPLPSPPGSKDVVRVL